MIKLSRTGITTLKRQYRAVLLKCLLINAGILLAANGAMAADYYVAETSGGANGTKITLGTAAATNADAYATAAQGATADATAATVATYGDIVTHNVAEFATAAQGAKADQAATDIGTMSDLTTTATNLVAAINEVKTTADNAANRDLSNLTTAGTAVITTAITNNAQNATYTNTTSGLTATTIKGAIDEIADDINVETAGNYIAAGKGVGANLTALDTRAKTNADDITVLKANTSTLGSAIGGTFAADGSFTHTEFSIANNISATDASIVTAIGDLDTAVGKVAADTYNVISATNTVAANLQALDGAFTSGNIDANFKSITSTNGYSTTDGSFTTTNGDFTTTNGNITGAHLVASTDLKIGGANAITGSENTLNINNSLTGVKDITSTALTTSAGDYTASLGLAAYETSVIGKNVNIGLDGAANAAVSVDNDGEHKATVKAGSNSVVVDGEDGTTITGTAHITGDTTVAGTLTVGEANAITGTEDTLDMGGNDLTNIKNITTTGTVNINGATLTGSEESLTSNRKIISENGFEVDENNALTSDGLTAAAATIAGATSVGGDLTVTGATTLDSTLAVAGLSHLDGGINVKNKFTVEAAHGYMTAAGGKFTVGEHGYMTAANGKFQVNEGGSLVASNGAFTVDKVGNTVVGGDLTVAGESWLKNTNVEGALAVSEDATVGGALTADGESKFAKDDEGVYSLDVTTDGVTANKVITAAAGVKFGTDETPMTSVVREAVAAKADEANNSVVASAAALQATRAAINSDVASVLGGVFAIDDTEKTVSYDNTALAGTNGFDNAAGDLTEALTNYANHVAAATGLSYDATGANVTTYARADEVNYAGIADNTSLRDAIVQLDTNIGDAPTTTINNVAATKTVNANIDAINTALGDVQTAIENSHYGQGANDMSEMVSKVDNKLYSLDRDVRKLKKEFKAGMASMAAMSALVPNARANGNTQLSIGTGGYDGHMAAAVGGFHWFNNNVMLNVGASYGDSSEVSYRAGLTFTW